MGTIVERPRNNGSIAYFAQILVMRDSKIVHRQSRTFDRRPPAAAWIDKREAERAKPDWRSNWQKAASRQRSRPIFIAWTPSYRSPSLHGVIHLIL